MNERRGREINDKLELARVLSQMEHAVKSVKTHSSKLSEEQESATKLQRAFKKILNRIRFQKAFYKLVLFRHLVESKMHKETLILYKAFEKLAKNPKQETQNSMAEYLKLEKECQDEQSIEAMKAQILSSNTFEKQLAGLDTSTEAGQILKALMIA